MLNFKKEKAESRLKTTESKNDFLFQTINTREKTKNEFFSPSNFSLNLQKSLEKQFNIKFLEKQKLLDLKLTQFHDSKTYII